MERYDQDAEDYERYWAPVLDASARGLLTRLAGPDTQAADGPLHIVDVGTGTGVLALEARRMWPEALVTGVDPSTGMLSMAARRAAAVGVPADDPRLRWVQGSAAAIPLPDHAAAMVVSSFVLQLVPDRAAALHEAFRVLRPGGRLMVLTWLQDDAEFRPSLEFDEAVVDLGIPEPEADGEEDRAGDFSDTAAAAAELAAAGFAEVEAREELLEHRWTAESYLAFKQHYDEAWLFELLEGPHADRLMALVRDRFAALHPDAFTWRTPLVSLVARRPG